MQPATTGSTLCDPIWQVSPVAVKWEPINSWSATFYLYLQIHEGGVVATDHCTMPQYVRPELLQTIHHGELFLTRGAVSLFIWSQRWTGIRDHMQEAVLTAIAVNGGKPAATRVTI